MFPGAPRYPRAVISRLPAGYYYISPQALPELSSQFATDQSRYPVSAPASGGIVSSPADVTKWARALFTGRELPRKQQRELESLISTKTGEPIKPLPVGQDPDALRTTDAALIVMTYTVLRAGSPDVTEAGDKRKAPDRGTYYFRTSAMFETSAKQYDWLRRIICVRPGNRLADGPAYNIFEVPS